MVLDFGVPNSTNWCPVANWSTLANRLKLNTQLLSLPSSIFDCDSIATFHFISPPFSISLSPYFDPFVEQFGQSARAIRAWFPLLVDFTFGMTASIFITKNFFTKYHPMPNVKHSLHTRNAITFQFFLFYCPKNVKQSCKPNSFSINVVGINLDNLYRAVRNHVNLLFGADYL